MSARCVGQMEPARPDVQKQDAAAASALAADLDARFFRGLGDPTRLRIVQLLLDGERTVSEIVKALGGLQGRISSHLMCLRWCGFVTTHREGKWVYYSVTDPRVREVLRLAQSMRRAPCRVARRRRHHSAGGVAGWLPTRRMVNSRA